MADYMIEPRSGTVYEVLATRDDWVWVLRDGAMPDTLHSSLLEPYVPTPVVGEVWSTPEGNDVVVVGRDETAEQWVTVPVWSASDAWGEPLPVTGFADGELFAKRAAREPRAVPSKGEPEAAVEPAREPRRTETKQAGE